MNKFREKLADFILYLRDYNLINTVIFTLFAVAMLYFILPTSFFLNLLCILPLLTPCFLVHLVEAKENRVLPKITKDKIFSKNNFLSLLPVLGHYIVKYLKSYLFFLIILVIAFLLANVTSIISLSLLLVENNQSLGLSLILIFTGLILIEGLFVFLGSLFNYVYIQQKNLNEITGIFKYRPVFKKCLFSHLMSLIVFAIFCLPLAMLSDILDKYIYVSMLFRTLYVLIVLNYAIFDSKYRIAHYKETKKRTFKDLVLFKKNSKNKH